MSPFYDGGNAVMAASTSKAVSAAEEQRCICIIIDSTSDSRRKHTHTLPLSTTTDQLFEVVAKKLKYVRSTFVMTFSDSPESLEPTERNRVEPSQVQTLDDVGFIPDRKTYLQICHLNGKKPVVSQMTSITEQSNDEATTSATEWSYANNSSAMEGTSLAPPPPPVPPKIGYSAPRRDAISGTDKIPSFSESISEAASKFNGCDFKGTDSKGTRLIGLVNQAMTCYLNSLIQTLYMTPEFRNALYEWEYKGSVMEAATTIPFQLQRLFLALQTSDKQSVETTDLTKSFGWDSSEAWQQHDIQELCRVMFDALEQKFKESADDSEKMDESKCAETGREVPENAAGPKSKMLEKKEQEIIKLYEGKMKDYVQCEECKNETSRNDTYLDIAIPIRPFGSSVAYRTVREGLEAFVTPEKLDGSNQYFCEKCNKKCDAKKGLKFTSFPYLLTLQLKRFDFDYTTFHRVKLNDRMYFPEKLDLSSFIGEDEQKASSKDQNSDEASDSSGEIDVNEAEGEEEIDTSSRDSGNDDDRPRDRRHDHLRSRNVSDSEGGSSVDEGIEIESQSGRNGAIGGSGVDEGLGSGSSTPAAMGAEACSNADFEKLRGLGQQKNKYMYELFSIMIHSGSAVGGHYYAYIKSFDDGQWYCFNDQIVTPISDDDIEKSYGGSGSRSTYSSSYSSSTNAYMLMYRQIDPERNKAFVKSEDLPDHIKRLIVDEVEREKMEKEQKEKEKNMCSIKVYCRHQSLTKRSNATSVDVPFEFHNSMTLREATQQAYYLLKLGEHGVALENCRLVKYDNFHQSLDQSLDDEEANQDEPLAQLLGGSRMSYLFDLLMETKEDHERFDVYKPGGVTIKVFPADYNKGCFLDQVILRFMPDDTVYHLKQALAKRLRYPLQRIRIALEKFTSDVHFLTCASQTLKDAGYHRVMKIYVDLMNDEESKEFEKIWEEETTKYSAKYKSVRDTRLWTLIDRTANLITVDIELPEDAKFELPPSRPMTPPTLQLPPSPTDSIPPLIDRSPPSEIENCPKPPPGSVRSTPSIDEGVGSYDGSSGSNSVPKTAECSACASPREKAQPIECPADFQSGNTQSDEKNSFWQPSDGASCGQNDEETMMDFADFRQGVYMASPPSPARRNSEEDEGCSPGHTAASSSTFADFEKLLGSKLTAAGLNQSPTSSLQCEGGSSDSASETSGEFEIQDTGRQQGDGAIDSAGSCSTIDSTGTLCNNAEDSSGLNADGETGMYPPHSYCTVPTATVMSSLPGISGPMLSPPSAFPGNSTDETMQSNYSDESIGKGNETLKTKIDSEFCACSLGCSTFINQGSAINDCMSGPGYLCAKCGRLKSGCVSDALNQSYYETCPSLMMQDPESGEGLDNIQPLFSELINTECGAGDKATEAKPKYLEMSMIGSAKTNESRGRTESSSSDLGYGDQNYMQHTYFRVTSTETNDQKCQVLKAQLDKRMLVGGLKQQLQPIVGTSTKNFSVYRVYPSGLETELNTLTESFMIVPSDSNFRVKHQRALRKDEYRCKVYHLNLTEDDHIKHLVDWVVKRGQSIKEARKLVSEELEKECSMTVKPEHIRLRKKHIKNPGQIFLPTDIFGSNIIISTNTEVFLEMLEKPDEKTNHNQLSIFCRRWRPSSLTLDPIQEVILDPDHESRFHTVDDLKKKLAEISGLNAEDIEWSRPKGTFPCLTSVLDIQDGQSWSPSYASALHHTSINIAEDGSLIFYRDKNETLKSLNDDERAEIKQKEDRRLAITKNSSNGSSSRPYFRKEKALKIYTVPSSTKKKKETTIF